MSENLNSAGKCQRCGATLAADAPEGLCPRCLMALNLATQTEVPGEEVGPNGTKVVKPSPPPPSEIAKHFPQLEILECLGRGGMGVVYKARQPKLNRIVALKILAPEKEADPKFAERFLREAQTLARLNHPNIVTIYDFGEADGLYYLMMEYVDGVSLRQLLQTRKIAPEEALAIVPRICEALQFAHEQGVVHRDIKPENVLLDKQGRVKIADFGIAKIVAAVCDRRDSADGGQRRSQTAATGNLTADQVLGTPHYMAPEQVEHPQTVDHRADIYSLGVVFYEMLTGELPLGKFQPPSRKVQIDVRLDEVVLHALEKEPERRYQQASQVKSDVETIATTLHASGEPTTQRPASRSSAKTSSCYFSTPERMRNCFPSAAVQIFVCKGELRLEPEVLTFITAWQTRVVIPLKDIVDLSIGQFQMWTTPWVMQYGRVNFLSVTFSKDGRKQTVHLTPLPEGTTSAQRINEQIGGWFEAIQKAVIARTGAVPRASEPRAVSFSAEPTWNRKVAPLLVAFLAAVGLSLSPFRSVFNSAPEPLRILVFVTMWLLLVALLWFLFGFLRANRAIKRGDLDAVTSNEPPENLLLGCSGPNATPAQSQREEAQTSQVNTARRAQLLRIKEGVFVFAATCGAIAAYIFTKQGQLLPGVLAIVGMIGFGVAAYRHARAAASFPQAAPPGAASWLQRTLIPDDVAARWGQWIFFAIALFILVLGIRKLTTLGLGLPELFFGVVLVLILSFLLILGGLLIRPISKPSGSGASNTPRKEGPSETSRSLEEPALAEARRQVKGPAIGLLVTGILNWILIPLAFLLLGGPAMLHDAKYAGLSQPIVLALALTPLALCSFIIYAALKMMRLEGYWAAMVAGVLAILVTPGNIVGLPVGLWALLTLDRRNVRNAFGVRKPRTGQQALLFRLPLVVVRGGRRVTYWPGVLVTTLIFGGLYVGALTLVVLLVFHGDPLEKQFRLLCALASTAVLVVPLAAGMWIREGHGTPIEELPHLDATDKTKPLRGARWLWIVGSLILLALLMFLAGQMFNTKPNLLVSGTVTDAVTGKPIAGARVADNFYGSRPDRAPQEAWTDAEGRYVLNTWYEEHTLAASAPGFETKLATLLTKPFGSEREVRMDFHLRATNVAVGPAIERVVVSQQRALIEGRGSPDSRIVFNVGEEGKWGCDFHNDSPFTATLERPMWGRGLNGIIKDARGNVLLTLGHSTVGPPGLIVFREGTPQPETDGSFVIGELRPETGVPLPIKVWLEKIGEPSANKTEPTTSTNRFGTVMERVVGSSKPAAAPDFVRAVALFNDIEDFSHEFDAAFSATNLAAAQTGTRRLLNLLTNFNAAVRGTDCEFPAALFDEIAKVRQALDEGAWDKARRAATYNEEFARAFRRISSRMVELAQQQRQEDIVSFSPVIERVISGEGDKNRRFIDFDTGKQFAAAEFFGPKDEPSPEETQQWWKKTGIDAIGDTSPAVRGLVGFEMVAVSVPNEEWDRLAPSRLESHFELAKPGTPVMMSGKRKLPATYAIKTREGGRGLLQIMGFSDKPPGVKIRSKLVQTGSATSHAPLAAAEIEPPIVQFRWIANEEDTNSLADMMPENGHPERKLRVLHEVLLDAAAFKRVGWRKRVDGSGAGAGRANEVVLEFTDVGRQHFAKITGSNIGRRLAIVLDNTILSSPVIASAIDSSTVNLSENLKGDEWQKLLDTLTRIGGEQAHYEFAEMRVCVLPQVKNTDQSVYLNLKHNRWVTNENRDIDSADFSAWAKSKSVDITGGSDVREFSAWLQQNNPAEAAKEPEPIPFVTGIEFLAIPADTNAWESVTSLEVAHHWELMTKQPENQVHMGMKAGRVDTYMFRTRNGSFGLLQILGFSDSPRGVKIRYKLTQREPAEDSGSKP